MFPALLRSLAGLDNEAPQIRHLVSLFSFFRTILQTISSVSLIGETDGRVVTLVGDTIVTMLSNGM